MPRYFFDTHDGRHTIDEVGIECADFKTARAEAIRALPELGRFAILTDGDQQRYVIQLRDEHGTLVSTATLTYAGLRLNGSSVKP